LTIHQVVVGAGHGDAITNEALALRAELRRTGPSEVFAAHMDEVMSAHVLPLEQCRLSAQDLLVVHGSIGNQRFFDLLETCPARMVLRYHNITPAEFFRPWDGHMTELLESGRDAIAAMRERFDLVVADSHFNAGDLAGMGYHGVAVCPVIFDPARLSAGATDPDALPTLGIDPQRPMVLCVGRVSPNKAQVDAVTVFHVLKTYFDLDAQLVLCGSDSFVPYARAVRAAVSRLELDDVTITGLVPDATLAAMYRSASCLLSVSRHEGFCVPLVEAMAVGVPIVAIEGGAVGETLGDGGLRLPNAEPVYTAAVINRVLKDQSLRQDLVARAQRRVEAFQPESTRKRLLELVESVA